MRIGVFDSGVGGLTVLNHLINTYPNHEYIYYGDTKNVPYGNKSIEELEKLVDNIFQFMLSKRVDIIVIACGTVSSNLADKLRKKYSINIIDIVSPTINYINNSHYKNIGVIATKRTIESGVFSNRINKKIKEIACPEFAELIEKRDFNLIDEYIKIYLSPLKDCDLIILGCTHYPIIKSRIKKYLNNDCVLLDMSMVIPNEFLTCSKKSVDLYFTKYDNNIIENIDFILNFKVNSINII